MMLGLRLLILCLWLELVFAISRTDHPSTTVSDYVTRDANGEACVSGSTELQTLLTDVNTTLYDAIGDLNAALDACSVIGGLNIDDLTAAKNDIKNMEDIIESLTVVTDCETIHNLWVGLLGTAFCTNYTEESRTR